MAKYSNVKKKERKINVTRLLPAHVVSSKHPEDITVQFVSKGDVSTTVFSQNIHCNRQAGGCVHVSLVSATY